MSITVSYNSLASLGANFGLADYLAHYESTFALQRESISDGFSLTNDSGGGILNPADYIDRQYAYQVRSVEGQMSTFIAEAAAGQNLAYTHETEPARTYYGPLDKLTFGSDLGLNLSTKLWQLSEDYLTIEGLSTVLNDGVSNGAPIPGQSGQNDTHNVISSLRDGNTDALREVFDAYGITIEGTSGNDEFNSYAASDTFVSSGGQDSVLNFDGSDIIDLSGLNFADADDALASVTVIGGNTVLDDGVNTITLVGYTGSFTADNLAA